MLSESSVKLAERITKYLALGGLFNPELADHGQVRDLLIQCRDALAASAAPQATGGLRELIVKWRAQRDTGAKLKQDHPDLIEATGIYVFEACAMELEAALAQSQVPDSDFDSWYEKYPDTKEYLDGMRDAFEAGRRAAQAGPAPAGLGKEPLSWKGIRWKDSIRAANLAEEIALHFAHDCEDSMCGEDADASSCETAWIEDKLTDFLESIVIQPAGLGEALKGER